MPEEGAALLRAAPPVGIDSKYSVMPPIQTGKPVGVPLRDFFHRWKEISTDSWILQVVGEGLRQSFSEHSPLANSPVWTKIPTDVGKARALLEEVAALLQKRAIERKKIKLSLRGFTQEFSLYPSQMADGDQSYT